MRTTTAVLVWLFVSVGCVGESAEIGDDQQPVNAPSAIGAEVALAHHLADGDELDISLRELLRHGAAVFSAVWTGQEGGGRPMSTGTGGGLVDSGSPLLFPRNFNRVSAPDSNSCAGCHAQPVAGGEGDFVANVFVLAQRFDFATFAGDDDTPLRGSVDELGNPVTLQSIGNSRSTPGMFGSGFIEMLARQMSSDLQAARDATPAGGSTHLTTKGISFGTLHRAADGSWETDEVEGLPAPSLASSGPADPPNLIIRPFHQAGAVISLRQFTNNAMNHHHGMQSTERFGDDTDPDGDGFVNELTRADITAASVWQAALAVPGRVIPNDPDIEEAVLLGEQLFDSIGCATCHVSSLPLDDDGWIYTEPNPFNPPGNLQVGDAPDYDVDLTDKRLPRPRLRAKDGVVLVPAYTDLKLHDITSGPGDPNREPLDMHQPAGSLGFFAGNSRFLTRKLWGVANTPPYFHHGQYTTMRQAIEAHAGDAQEVTLAYLALSAYERDSVIEFLKTLQVLPRGTRHLVVDERGKRKKWPPKDEDDDD